MSPLSVAQFLAPPHGLKPGLTFDLLVIDEASQVEPVDALGAIARCRQMVVVGDDKQMPPTRFFQRMTSEDDETIEEDTTDSVAAREVESILGLANARGVPNALLRWHYRSRHESLIATSNAEFYNGQLMILPAARARSATLGLSLVRVEGTWQQGAGVNLAEAEAVAQAVLTRIPPTNMAAALATDARSTRCMVNCRFLGCRPQVNLPRHRAVERSASVSIALQGLYVSGCFSSCGPGVRTRSQGRPQPRLDGGVSCGCVTSDGIEVNKDPWKIVHRLVHRRRGYDAPASGRHGARGTVAQANRSTSSRAVTSAPGWSRPRPTPRLVASRLNTCCGDSPSAARSANVTAP